jgi:hypothetical protein
MLKLGLEQNHVQMNTDAANRETLRCDDIYDDTGEDGDEDSYCSSNFPKYCRQRTANIKCDRERGNGAVQSNLMFSPTFRRNSCLRCVAHTISIQLF